MTDSTTPPPKKGRIEKFFTGWTGEESGIVGNVFDMLVDPVERQYPKMLALLLIMATSIFLTSLLSYWGVGLWAIPHFVLVGVLAWAAAFKPKLLALVGLGGVIDGYLTDKDKSKESASWVKAYYYLFRRAFWFYTVLSIIPIIIPFVHSYVSYWMIVAVALLQFAARFDDTKGRGLVRGPLVNIASIVIFVIAIWMMLPPYTKGVYFAQGSSIYLMEPDRSEIHHDRLAKHCKVDDGEIIGTTVPGAPEGTDCTSPYTGEPLKLVTPKAAEEHGIRPWTIASVRQNLITFLETDWFTEEQKEESAEVTRAPVTTQPPYMSGYLGTFDAGEEIEFRIKANKVYEFDVGHRTCAGGPTWGLLGITKDPETLRRHGPAKPYEREITLKFFAVGEPTYDGETCGLTR